jgi:hypothetical protein
LKTTKPAKTLWIKQNLNSGNKPIISFNNQIEPLFDMTWKVLIWITAGKAGGYSNRHKLGPKRVQQRLFMKLFSPLRGWGHWLFLSPRFRQLHRGLFKYSHFVA